MSEDEFAAIIKEVRETKVYWIKAHEMFQEELDDLDKTQQVIIESLRIYGNVLDKLKAAVK